MASAGLNQDLAERHHKEIRIIVNGERKQVETHELSFDEIVSLAYNGNPPVGPNWVFTVTYRRAEGKKHEGSLSKGQTVKIKEGTIFDVTATDKS